MTEFWEGIKRFILTSIMQGFGFKDVHLTKYIDADVLINPTAGELTTALSHSYHFEFVDDLYDGLKWVVDQLYLGVSDLVADIKGPFILRLPSGLAWKLINDDNTINDFRMASKDYGNIGYFYIKYTILLQNIYVIFKTSNTDLEYYIKESEHWTYFDVGTGDVKTGLEFEPVKGYDERAMRRDIFIFSLILIISSALVHAGKTSWASGFVNHAVTTINSIKTVSLNNKMVQDLTNLQNKLKTVQTTSSSTEAEVKAISAAVASVSDTLATMYSKDQELLALLQNVKDIIGLKLSI